MFTSVTVAALAVAPVATLAFPGSRYSSFGKKFNFPDYEAPPNNGYSYSRDTSRSSVKCKAVAGTKNFKKSVSAHVSAITEAFAYACDSEPSPSWLYRIKERMRKVSADYDQGLAYAKAIAAAKTDCTSEGNAYGCAAAYAYSAAWAKAVVSAHAKAWADAIVKCPCDLKDQEAGASAGGKAKEFEELNAKVQAYAKAKVCVSGDDSASDYDAQTCVQDIYATLFAKSVSLAVLRGKCVNKDYLPKVTKEYGAFYTKAIGEAEAEIDVKKIQGCVGYVDLYNPYL